MKKRIVILLCICFLFGMLPGCNSTPNANSDGKLHIVTTIFPEYDWVREILGEKQADADITMLLDSGVDLHSYQPTASDIIKISTCDLFIYTGGESDKWVDDALAEATNKDMVVINLLETLGDAAKEEETVEGMEATEEAEEEEEGIEYDEHVWLSLKNASFLCRCIADRLGEIDKDNKDVYSANADAYIEKLDRLDADYQSAVDAATVKTVLFGDRFPFRYLVDDYGLSYYAAFSGCSAETEASFETILFLAEKVDSLGLKAILQIESADGSVARTIKDSTKEKNQDILTMDSLQSVTAKEVEKGVTYLSVMEDNLSVLKNALQ